MAILIVEDEKQQMKSLCLALRSKGYQTRDAASAEQALARLHTEPDIDMVVTDHNMPGMGGMALIKAIRETSPRLPLIMITAYGDHALRQEAFENNCNGFLEKPFTIQELDDEIKRIRNHPDPGRHP